MQTYSFGSTPENVIRENLPDVYNMQLSGQDWEVFELAQNIGIDSHLEAVACDGRDQIELIENNVGSYSFNKLGCGLSKDGMICLLRRLFEHDFGSDELNENAWSLRSSILYTIDIEEI